MTFAPRHAVIFLACASLGGFAGCGGDDTDKERLTEERIQKERKEAARIARQEERVKQLERELRDQKKRDSQPTGSAPSAPSAPSTAPSSGTTAPAGTSHCGGGVYVNSSTTCPFAQNVRNAYAQSGGGDTTVEAYSAATGRTFFMSCSGGSPHVCFGGNNAKVYFP